eukprot:6727514-Ditylum_brightwellii.AAC.1
MQKIMKCKPVDMVEGKFDLVEPLLKGYALTHWLKYKQIELLKIVKQKHEAIVVDDNFDKQKKSSSQNTNSANSKANTKGKLPSKEKMKTCILCQQFEGYPNYHTAKDCYRHKVSKTQTSCKHPAGDHTNVEDLYVSNLNLTK